MRAPKAFLPKKRLEKQVKDLSTEGTCLISSAKDLILGYPELDNSKSRMGGSDEISDSWFATHYPYFSSKNIVEKRFTDYQYRDRLITVDVVRFKDKTALEASIQADWRKNFCSYYLKDRQCSILLKDECMIIIYAPKDSSSIKRYFISAFRKKFGFREYKK